MIVTAVLYDVPTLLVWKLKKWIPVVVIVKAGQVDECASELVN